MEEVPVLNTSLRIAWVNRSHWEDPCFHKALGTEKSDQSPSKNGLSFETSNTSHFQWRRVSWNKSFPHTQESEFSAFSSLPSFCFYRKVSVAHRDSEIRPMLEGLYEECKLFLPWLSFLISSMRFIEKLPLHYL